MSTIFSLRTFFILSGLFIIYATTIPWDLTHAPTLDGVSWIPLWDPERGRPPSIPDLVQNVVLFVPFGFFGALSLKKISARGVILGTLMMGAIGFSLSLFVEILQTMSETRSPSASDLTTNTLGTLGGAFVALIYVRHFAARAEAQLIATSRAQPGFVIFSGYLVAIVIGSLAPFIPTLDISSLRANIRGLLDNPWGEKVFGALIADGLLWAALTFLAAYEAIPYLRKRLSFGQAKRLSLRTVSRIGAACAAAAGVIVLAGALEFAQLFILGHSPGLQDVAVAAFAAIAGAVLVAVADSGPIAPARHLGELSRRRAWLVFAFAIAAPAARALSPLIFVSLEEKMASDFSWWQLVPFWALFRNVNVSTFRNVFEAALFYLPLGWALASRGSSPRVVFVAALVLAEVLEILQLFIAGRTYDITEGLYAGACALAGAWALGRLSAQIDARANVAAQRAAAPSRQ